MMTGRTARDVRCSLTSSTANLIDCPPWQHHPPPLPRRRVLGFLAVTITLGARLALASATDAARERSPARRARSKRRHGAHVTSEVIPDFDDDGLGDIVTGDTDHDGLADT
jgi:hypothetical protein